MGRFSPRRTLIRTLSSFALLCWVPAFAAACGGASTGSQSTTPDRSPHSDLPGDPDDVAEGPAASPCNDSSCFSCGTGLCPTGFYCDESIDGGPACSWSPTCAQKPDCACLLGELGSGCTCEARDGGVYVRCG